MEEMKEYSIPFVGLKTGTHEYDFRIDQSFFEHFEYDEFTASDIKVKAILEKKSNFLEFDLNFNGEVTIACDLTNEPFQQPLEGDFHFVVKFGEEFNDEDEELIILPHGSHQVNIQQQIYESVVLAVPSKRIHPGVEDGSLKSEILEKLEELSPQKDDIAKEGEQETDPRWDDLKKLLTDK